MKNRITAVSLAICLLAYGGIRPAYALTADVQPVALVQSAGIRGLPVNHAVQLIEQSAVPANLSASFRTGTGVENSTIEINPEDGYQDVPMEMKAKITVPLISVSLPADGFEFTVDPKNHFEISDPTAQITSPDVVIANHSVVPVKLEISNVARIGEQDVTFSPRFPGGPDRTFKLVDTISEVGPAGTAILVLGRKDQIYTTSQDFEQYAIVPERQGIMVAEIPAEENAVIKLYGKVAPDFYGEYQFTVKPTLKISAVRAQ